MKIIDAIKNVIRSEKNKAYLGEEFYTAFDLNYYDVFKDPERITAYYIHQEYCTDTSVGIIAYLFDDKPLAVSSQWGRKCSVGFNFVNEEIYHEARKYLVSLVTSHDPYIPVFSEDEAIEDLMSVEFFDRLMDDEGYHNGRKCFVQRNESRLKAKNDIIYKNVIVRYEDNGDVAEIPVEEFKFPLRVSN